MGTIMTAKVNDEGRLILDGMLLRGVTGFDLRHRSGGMTELNVALIVNLTGRKQLTSELAQDELGNDLTGDVLEGSKG